MRDSEPRPLGLGDWQVLVDGTCWPPGFLVVGSRSTSAPNVGLILGYEKNIFFALQLMLASLIVFQVPVVLEILLYMHVVTRRALLRSTRFVTVVIFVVAAVITPPDVLSQMAVAIPLTILYFLTILVAKIFGFGGEP